MLWFVIFGILLILILGIIITMVKIIKGSNDLQEMRERPPGRDKGRGARSGNRNRNNNRQGNDRRGNDRGSYDRSGSDRSSYDRGSYDRGGSDRSSSNRGGNDRGDRSSSNRGNRSRDGSSDRSRSNRSQDAEYREGRHVHGGKPRAEAGGGGKRRWKIILIDVATHEEYEFIFSDAIGLGRAFAKEGYEDYLVINDPKVSKRHCSILTEADSLYIQDEGSSNGTYVNNQRVGRPMMVQKEDIISIGNTELEIFKVFRESN